MKKKLLFLTILFIAMVFIGMPKVEALDINTLEELASYLNATLDGDTITLTGGKTIEDADGFRIFNDFTIDLNGHTLTNNSTEPIRIESNASIKNGTINGSVSYWKTLTIENATITELDGKSQSSTIIKGIATINGYTNGNITIENGATLIIDSNDFRFGYHDYNHNGHLLTNNGTILIKDSNSVFTIDSGNNILNNGTIANYGTFTNNGTLASASTSRILNNPYKLEKLAMTNGNIESDIYYSLGNETITLTINPKTGYMLKNGTLKVMNGQTEVQLTEVDDTIYTFTMPSADVTVFAEFEKIPYTITVNNVEGATINPNGVIDVVYGDNKEITIKANAGYKLKSVKVNDIPQTLPLTNNKVTLTNIQENKTITVVVEKIPYTITINNTIGGTITADKLSATINDIVTLTVAPDTYYKLKNITGITMTKVNDTTYTYTMPSENVTIDAEFELIFEEKTITKTVGDLTVGIKGTFSQNPEIVITKIEKGNNGYDSLITLVKEDKEVIGSYNISITGGTYIGDLELTFTIGKQYEGDKIIIYHKLANGEIETKTAIVKDGKATITVNELSPFMLATDKEIVAKKDETPKTGIATYIGITVFVTGLAGVGAITLKKKKFN